MVKALQGNRIFLGLSDKNLEKLKDDQPIVFNLKQLGLQNMEVCIFNMATEEDMRKFFKDKIDPFKTIIHDDNAKNN